MKHSLRHEYLGQSMVEARGYQLEAVDEALSGSTLLVLPTGAGKSAIAWMVIAETLSKEKGWILMIAPTIALVKQHQDDLTKIFGKKGIEPLGMSGGIIASKRVKLWGSSRLVVSTPKVIRNDVENGILDLSKCSLLVVDEAHHTIGDRGEAQVAELFLNYSERPLILGMTASPGSSIEKIMQICNKLAIERIHLRSSNEPMLEEYLASLNIDELRVKVPDEIKLLAEPLIKWQEDIVDRERRIGRYVMSGPITHSGLANAMERANTAIQRGERNAYTSMSNVGLAMSLHHLINHLLCQGISASREFLDRKELGEDANKKSTRNLLRDKRIRDLRSKLSSMDESHSKVSAVRRLIRDRIRQNPDARIIVFATFRDTVASLEKVISGLEGIKPTIFIGQSKRGSEKGLTPREQVERIEDFRKGIHNILIATSVGEEGLDIPSADLVIFYEPVSSEIRYIQRRGRTGRQRDGDVVVLIAEDTRDEGALAAAQRREESMHLAVAKVRRKLPRKIHIDLSNLNSFEIKTDINKIISAKDFVKQEREKHRPSIVDADLSENESKTSESTIIHPSTFRPKGQKGLEEFNSGNNE